MPVLAGINPVATSLSSLLLPAGSCEHPATVRRRDFRGPPHTARAGQPFCRGWFARGGAPACSFPKRSACPLGCKVRTSALDRPADGRVLRRRLNAIELELLPNGQQRRGNRCAIDDPRIAPGMSHGLNRPMIDARQAGVRLLLLLRKVLAGKPNAFAIDGQQIDRGTVGNLHHADRPAINNVDVHPGPGTLRDRRLGNPGVEHEGRVNPLRQAVVEARKRAVGRAGRAEGLGANVAADPFGRRSDRDLLDAYQVIAANSRRASRRAARRPRRRRKRPPRPARPA